jgi:ABC-type nitrate/sulfonate/bicarbonate transport system substrate-binding protein
LRRPAFLAATAAAIATPSLVAGQTLPMLRLGGSGSQDIIGSLFGIHGGVFRKYGLDVQYMQLNGGEVALAALLGGSLEIAKVAIFDIIRAHVKNVPIVVQAPSEIYRAEFPDAALVVARDSAIHKGADLNGKTLSSPALGDFFAVANKAWIDANGGDSRTVKFIELPGRATVAAIASGRIDAASLADPVLNDAIAGGVCRILGYSMNVFGKQYCATAYVTTTAYAAANGDVMARWRKALSEAAVYANAHRSEMIPIIAQATGVDAAVLALLPPSMAGTTEQLRDPKMFQPVIDEAVKYKVIPRSFPYTELIDPNALKG